MRLCTERFRCDLCGRYARRGVEETKPVKVTRICTSCVESAVGLLLHDTRLSTEQSDDLHCPVHGGAAEDRSKPAPGWSVERDGIGDWNAFQPNGDMWARDMSWDEAVRETWAQHDAQQAGDSNG